MAGVAKTKEKIDTSISKNETRLYIMRMSDPRGNNVSWKTKHEIFWKKYQIKETDMRAKTATFTSNTYLDLTAGTYCVLITSPQHEDFGGVILSVEREKDTGLYNYQCQDFTRLYIDRVDAVLNNVTLHRLLKWCLSKCYVPLTGDATKMQEKWSVALSGLKPAYQYDQEFYGSIIKNWNPMTMSVNAVIKGKTLMEIIRDYVLGSGAYIDVYPNKYGVIQIEPYHKDDWLTSCVEIPMEAISDMKVNFNTTNIITEAIVESNDQLSTGHMYSSKDLVGLDLALIFGNNSASTSNPNQTTTATTTTSTSKSAASNASKKNTNTATAKKNSNNPYGTKKKVVHLNMDDINGYTNDNNVMKAMAKILKKNGWTVKIAGWGSESHYKKRDKVKNGVWFCLYGGVCAGTLKEHGSSSWFLNPLKKNKSRVVVGFFPPASSILKGGKYYKHLGPAYDWQGSQSYANLNYPAAWLSKHGVPFMYAKTAKDMVAKFLAGGDNYKKYGDGWTKHDVKWIK